MDGFCGGDFRCAGCGSAGTSGGTSGIYGALQRRDLHDLCKQEWRLPWASGHQGVVCGGTCGSGCSSGCGCTGSTCGQTCPCCGCSTCGSCCSGSTGCQVVCRYCKDSGSRRRPGTGVAEQLDQRLSLPGYAVLREDEGR